jgi:FixJ family two-component response regulator
MNEQTVFIVDDDSSVRKGLTRLLRAAGFNVESFASAREFLDSGCLERPGCIILDVQMPEMTGPELQEELGETQNSLPIIFLSAHGDVPITAQTMKNGAVDFLTKPVDGTNLINAIHLSIEKNRIIRVKNGERVAIIEKMNTLTPREYEVMTYVITGMLNKQIAGDLNISEETVKIHRGRVTHKLGIVSAAELVRLCEFVGIAPAKELNK